MSRARAIGALFGLNVLGAAMGIGVVVLTAKAFGTKRELEVFFAATTLQQVLFRFIQGGQVSEAFLPVYHRLRHQLGVKSARLAYSVTFNWAILAAVTLMCVVWGAAPWFLRMLVPGFSAADRELGVAMFRITSLLVPLQVAGALQIGLSNAEKWFGRPEVFGVLAQLVSVAMIWSLAPRFGVWAMVVSTCFSQLVVNGGYIWTLRRLGYRHAWRLRMDGFNPKEVFRNLLHTSGQMVAVQVYSIALNAGLSLLPQGSYAVFRYARQFQDKTGSLLLRPVSTVFFTHFSEASIEGPERVRSLARSALAKTLLLGLGSIATLHACALPLLQGLFSGEHYPAAQVRATATLTVWLMGLLVPTAVFVVLRRVLVTAGLMGALYTALAISQLCAAGLLWWLGPKWGLAGIVVLLGLDQVTQVAMCWWLLWRRRPELVFTPDWKHLGRSLLAAILSACVVWFVTRGLGISESGFSRWFHLLVAGSLGGLAVVLMLGVGALLKLPEVHRLREILGRRWERLTAADR